MSRCYERWGNWILMMAAMGEKCQEYGVRLHNSIEEIGADD
jgi:hypothetical protein